MFDSDTMAGAVDSPAAIRAVSWTLGAIIICMSAARLWVRFNILNQPYWDDLFNVLATVRPPIFSFQSSG